MTGRGAARTPALALAVQFDVPAAPLPRRATLRRWALAAAERDLAVTVRFVATREARGLNARFRGRDYATNVLTFVYDDVVPPAGDLVLCAPVLKREARAQGKTLKAHCAHLIVHGMLHLQGYDHERAADAARMEARETAILAGLGYPDPYASATG
jgi:probable rRNA maturation factor